MKKKVAVIVLAVIMAFSCSFGLTACGGNGEGGEHTHTYSQQWTSDETNHWHVCTECGEAEEKSPHKFGENNICEICGYERQQEEHVHAKPGDADYVITESTHGYTCSCGVVITEEHTFGADGKCTECGYEAHEHSRPDNATLTPSDTGHSYTCSCGETVEEVHNFDTENVCKVCGYALNPSEGLAFAEKDGEYTLEYKNKEVKERPSGIMYPELSYAAPLKAHYTRTESKSNKMFYVGDYTTAEGKKIVYKVQVSVKFVDGFSANGKKVVFDCINDRSTGLGIPAALAEEIIKRGTVLPKNDIFLSKR